ncbi:MAG: alkaline phosphatase family protein, partial [Prevotellaceae bacterium]|nr:alkaline phosphatase family protein [Prevotellaceae bacterium]
PDLLNVSLYAGTFAGRNPAVSALELQDTYERLDRALGTIIQSVEAKVGKGRVLFTLAGTGTFDREQADDERYRFPGGVFDMRRAVSLLNIYLANLYGKGNYIETTLGTEIFFNRRLIRAAHRFRGVAASCRRFLVRPFGCQDRHHGA